MDKPHALRLADDLAMGKASFTTHLEPAAAELRRLHQQNKELVDALLMVLDDPQALDGRPRTYEYVYTVLAKHKGQA